MLKANRFEELSNDIRPDIKYTKKNDTLSSFIVLLLYIISEDDYVAS